MRLTTDTPKNNLEMALNLFYVKDKEVWVRGAVHGGLFVQIRRQARRRGREVQADADEGVSAQ